MKQETPKQVPSTPGSLSQGIVVGSMRDILEVWELLKDVTSKPTVSQELGWPEWWRWF